MGRLQGRTTGRHHEFARYVPGARIKALQARMLEVGTEWGLLAFARDIPGANKKALIARSAVLRNERDGSSCPSMAGSLISFALQVES